MTDKERLPGLKREQWSDSVRAILDPVVEQTGEADPLPTLTLIAHQEVLLGPFLTWAGALALNGTASKRAAELIAMRTAYLCDSVFEWREHSHYARWAGLTDDEIEAIGTGPAAPTWNDIDRACLQAADELTTTPTLTDKTWAALESHFPPAELVELILVAGQYRMLSTLANAAGVDASLPDGPSLPRGASKGA